MVNSAEPVLAEVWRGDYLEAQHHGSIAITDPAGQLLVALGDVTGLTLPRSAVKPIQTVAMLRNGLDVEGAELALVSASHAGQDFHRRTAQSILEGCGLDVSHLQTPPALPWDEEALEDWLRSGHGKEAIAHNCSGKHAGMLRTCVRAGWSTAQYRDPRHPLQRAARTALAEFTREPVGDPVVDGCGAPAFAVTLTGLARAFGTLASATHGEAATIADAIRSHPAYVSGDRRDEVVFHREVPGLVCKLGAEGAFAFGLADGTGVAIKIADGNHRGCVPVVIAVLDALNLASETLRSFDPLPILGHGQPVGGTRVTPALTRALGVLAAG